MPPLTISKSSNINDAGPRMRIQPAYRIGIHDPDQSQHLTTSSLAKVPPFHVIWFKSVYNIEISCAQTDGRTNKQTHANHHNTSSASLEEVITRSVSYFIIFVFLH